MKTRIFLTVLLSVGLNICLAQSDIDSVSRARADRVLQRFDTIQACKLLYSISNTFYYVIYPDHSGYKEFFIRTDTLGTLMKEALVRTARPDDKILSKAFNLRNYHKNYITKVENATVVQGNNSYFVLKDLKGTRYGEYCLSVLTSPIPIDGELYSYLVAELLKHAGKR